MQKSLKIVSVVILLLITMFLFPAKAEATSGFTWDSIINTGKQFEANGKAHTPVNDNNVARLMLPIGQFLVGIGIFVMVVVTIIMGIKYMSADPNTQAKLKQQMIGIVVAGIVIFGAYGIWTLVYNFMDGLF